MRTSLDISASFGRRDRAIVLCLATLGLRPGEVAGLRLEDIDWRDDTSSCSPAKIAVVPFFLCLVRPATRLPVTCAKERPVAEARRILVKHIGPDRGEQSQVIPSLPSQCVRFDVRKSKRAYVFRHSVASRIVRRGASLKEVTDFLGHRCLDTANMYAKVDLAALREVALPWPEVIQ